jgi:hypothetical protein
MTTRQYLVRRASRTASGTVAFLLVAGVLASTGPRGFVLRFIFAVFIAAVVIAGFWSLFEIPCLHCGKRLGRVGFLVAHGRRGSTSPQCPYCEISVDVEVPSATDIER